MSTSSVAEPGAEQDERTKRLWLERALGKHRLFKFRPPYGACKCGMWNVHAPGDMAIMRQRDYILDGFLEHRSAMAAVKRKHIAERKAAG